MLELKTKKELAKDSHTLAESYDLVRYKGVTYMPMDYETNNSTPRPELLRTMWVPLDRTDVREIAAREFKTLFSSDGELGQFDFMVSQHALNVYKSINSLLVKTPEGLKVLQGSAELGAPTGHFVPNTLAPVLNTSQEAKEEVYQVLLGWLDDKQEVDSLLRHLSTALSPGWSAVKYLLFLGEGRNGKSVLMKMLEKIFGSHNTSSVTRQQIAEQSPSVTELNGKLLNIVFDGQASFVKDSGMEKSLIAGEPVPIRKLYETTPTMVQTNALFLEGLNSEPRSNDKSNALQKRIVRFQFPNVFALDLKFEKRMLGEEMLGALLSLMLDHFVTEDEVASKLQLTSKSMELQLEHMYVNSVALQYIKYLEEESSPGAKQLLGLEVKNLVAGFQAWRAGQNDLTAWAEPDVMRLFNSLLNTDRVSKRIDNKPRKVRVISSFKVETLAFLETLEGDTNDELGSDEVVAGTEEGSLVGD